MKNFMNEIENKVLVYDGSKGTMLQKFGLQGGECPELWNVNCSENVKKVYRSYKDAGSDVIQTNTFQGNRVKLEEYALGDRTHELNCEGVKMAKEIIGQGGFAAASIGPIGQLFEPSGELTFDHAYDIYKEQVKAVIDGGADIINFETFTDLAEMRAALLAAKETSTLPVICSLAFEANGKTLMGTDPATAAIVLKSLGADMSGTNCSLGPEHLLEIIKKMYDATGMPLSVKPNAGLPELVGGQVIYKETPVKFSALTEEFVKHGVRLIGGCCGTTPEFISAIRDRVNGLEVPKLIPNTQCFITSGVRAIEYDENKPLNIGYISTCDDNQLLDELIKGNLDSVIDKALDLASEGYDAIHISVDKDNNRTEMLAEVVNTAQGYLKEPMIIETTDADALEKALRLYKGKAGVIIKVDSADKMNRLLSVAKKYGSTIIQSKG